MSTALERIYREVRIASTATIDEGAGNRGGGSLVLDEPGWERVSSLNWRWHVRLLRLSVSHSTASTASTASRITEELDGPEFDFDSPIKFVDVLEFITDDSAIVTPQVVVYVVTANLYLHRICVSQPSSGTIFSSSDATWGGLLESRLSYNMSPVVNAEEVPVVHSLCAIDCVTASVCVASTIKTVEFNPDTGQIAETKFQLSSMSVLPDFFRSFVYGKQTSTLPLSIARVALFDDSNPSNEIIAFVVMCSDGQLRLFHLGKLAPRSVFPVVDHAVDKALVRVMQLEAHKFTFVIYVAGESRSCFKECTFNSATTSLEVTTHIPDPQLPLIDLRVSEAHLWALWRTADGYMLQHWPLRWGVARTGSATWNPVHSLNDDEDAFELSSVPFTPPSGSASAGNRIDQFFERQLFEQRRFNDFVVRQVLTEYFDVPLEQLATPTDMNSLLHNLIHSRVEDQLRQNPALDGCAVLLTEWQLLIDSCKIVQRRREAPIALGFISSAATAPALLKTKGMSLLRHCDLSEKALWARAMPPSVDVTVSVPADNASLVQVLRASGRFLAGIENLDELLFDLDLCPPQILSVEVLTSVISGSISTSSEPGEMVRLLAIDILEVWAGVSEPQTALQELVGLLLLPTTTTTSDIVNSSSSSVLPSPGELSTISVSMGQLMHSRYVLLRDVCLLMSYLVGSADVRLPEAVLSTSLPALLRLMHSYLLMRWLSQRHLKPTTESAISDIKDDPFPPPIGIDTDCDSLVQLLLHTSKWKFDASLSEVDVALAASAHLFGRSASSPSDSCLLSDVGWLRICVFLVRQREMVLLQEFLSLSSSLIGLDLRVHYFAGRAALHFAQYDKAKHLFLKTAMLFESESPEEQKNTFQQLVGGDTDVDTDVDTEGSPSSGGVYRYFAHVMRLFESRSRIDMALQVAYTGLRLLPEGSTVRRHVQSTIFHYSILLCRFDEAFGVICSSIDNRASCLRQLVSALCASGQTARLCSLQWTSLRPEVEATLMRKATAADMNEMATGTVPDYYAILYAFAVQHNDYRGAAGHMHEAYLRWMRESGTDALAHQCKTLACAITALQLVPDHRWLLLLRPQATDVDAASTQKLQLLQQQQHMDRRDDAFDFDQRDANTAKLLESRTIVRVEDMERRFLLLDAQLLLANASSGLEQVTFVDLGARETISLLIEHGFVDRAFQLCSELRPHDLGTVFEALLSKCMALDHGALPKDVKLHVESTSSADLRAASWRLLRAKLEQFEPIDVNFAYSKLIASKLLNSSSKSKLPRWLLDRFLPKTEPAGFAKCGSDPVWMARLLLLHHLPLDAAAICLRCMPTPHPAHPTRFPPWLPHNLLNELLAVLRDLDTDLSLTMADRIEAQWKSIAAAYPRA